MCRPLRRIWWQQTYGQCLVVHDATTEEQFPRSLEAFGRLCPLWKDSLYTVHTVHVAPSFGSCVPTSFAQRGHFENCDLDFKNSNWVFSGLLVIHKKQVIINLYRTLNACQALCSLLFLDYLISCSNSPMKYISLSSSFYRLKNCGWGPLSNLLRTRLATEPALKPSLALELALHQGAVTSVTSSWAGK